MKQRHFNRQQRRKPRRVPGGMWCGRCDRQIVHDGGAKCPVCGVRNGRRRNKK